MKKNLIWAFKSINCKQMAVRPNDSVYEMVHITLWRVQPDSVAGHYRMNNDVMQREPRAVTNTCSKSPCITCFLLFQFLAGYTLTLYRYDMMSPIMYLSKNGIYRNHTTVIKPLFYCIVFLI